MLWEHIPAGTPCAHFLPPGANQGRGAPSCPRNPWRVQLRALVGGKVASCGAALHLVLDFSPDFQPPQRSGQIGFYPKSQPSAPHNGSGRARTPIRGTTVCQGEGDRAGSPLWPHSPLKSVQHKHSLLPGQLCQEWLWLPPSPRAARVWSQVAASQVPRQLQHLQGYLGTAGVFVLTKEKAKHPD